MTGPTVADVKSTQVDLWHFLAQMPSTLEAQQLCGLMIAGVVGMCGHYLVKWAQGEIAGSLVQYLFVDSLRKTMLSFFTYVGFALTTIASPALTVDGGGSVDWFTVLWIGLTSGYAIDSIANKGTRPTWTPDQREAAAATQPETKTAVLPVTEKLQ